MATILLATAFLGFLVQPSPGEPPAARPDEIADLIRQLGSDEFAQREAAHRKLEAFGEAAESATRKRWTSAPASGRRSWRFTPSQVTLSSSASTSRRTITGRENSRPAAADSRCC